MKGASGRKMKLFTENQVLFLSLTFAYLGEKSVSEILL